MREFIKGILEENQINHTKFASDLCVSRAYVLALLNGTKPVTDNIYGKMLRLDYIIPYERKLTEKFFSEKLGRKNYNLIKYFLQLASEFTSEPVKSTVTGLSFTEKFSVVHTNDFLSYIYELLSGAYEKGECFYTNYPFSFSELDDLLYSFCCEHKDYADKFFHTVNIVPELSKKLLNAYWKAVRFGFSGVNTDVTADKVPETPYPYFATAGNITVLFSENAKSAIYFNEEETAYAYRNFFGNAPKVPFVSVVRNAISLLSGGLLLSTKTVQSFDSSICPINIFDYDMLMEATVKSNPEELLQNLTKAFLKYYNIEQKSDKVSYFSYLTSESIEDWVETGRIYCVPSQYLNCLSVASRKTVLERLNKKDNWKMLKPSVVKLPKGYCLDSYEKNVCVHFMLTSYDSDIYELYTNIGKNAVSGLSEFLSGLFSVLSFENMSFTDDERRRRIEQLILLS